MIFNVLLAFGIVGWAAWWDVREFRVPNTVWIIAAIPMILSHVLDPWTLWAYLGAVPLAVGLVALRSLGWWGSADVKGCIWLLGTVGIPGFLLMLLIAVAVGGTGSQPFFKHLFKGTMAIGIPWLLFMLIRL